MEVTKATQLLIAAILVYGCSSQNVPEIINNSARLIQIREDTPIGTVIRTLQAMDIDGDEVTITFPEHNIEYELFTINQTTKGPLIAEADIILIKALDRDYQSSVRKLIYLLEDNESPSLQTLVSIDLFITDVNDEAPKFKNIPYRLFLPEDTAVGTTVYTDIHAKDPDTGTGGRVYYSIEPITQSSSDAAIFQETFSINEANGEITLDKELDYETLRFYQFQVMARDGEGLNSTEELIITLEDVQDTPPQFQGTPYVSTIPENIPQGQHFFTVRAYDGDRGTANDITFSFIGGYCADLFSIDNVTGEITVVESPDRDSGEILMNDGVCDITLLVEELTDQGLGDNATTILTLFIEDVNDNPPSFNNKTFAAVIENTAQSNFPLRFENDQRIIVTDADQGSNSVVELVLRYPDGSLSYDFEPDPNVLASSGSPIIKLKNPAILKELSEITIILYAEERDTAERLSATAIVVIEVLTVTTTPAITTTEPPTTTTFFQDPFIPSVLGVVLPGLLLIWAAVFTIYYCLKRKGYGTNKIGVANGNIHHPLPLPQDNPPLKPVFKRNSASNA